MMNRKSHFLRDPDDTGSVLVTIAVALWVVLFVLIVIVST
jgi:hypothetical protein